MYTILHLSYDYAESTDESKTAAIGELVKQTREFSFSQVISLDRVSKREEEIKELISSEHLKIKSYGLPYGVLLLTQLKRAYKKILQADTEGLLNLQNINVIHAHKLTFEGFLGYWLACKYDLPLFISLRQTDFMVLKHRPDLHHAIKSILKRSVYIFYIVPYMVDSIKKFLGRAFFEKHIEQKLVFLPNIINHDISSLDMTPVKGSLLTVVRMTRKSVKRKNIKNLFRGLKMCADHELYLDIIGDGEYLEIVKGWAKKLGISRKTNFLGAVPNSEIDKYYAKAHAFLMPSYSETFGMAYAEALLNETPILYSKGTGFDGMFERVGIAVDPKSYHAIGEAVMKLIDNNKFYRNTIRKLKKNNAFHIFGPEYAKKVYQECLNNLH